MAFRVGADGNIYILSNFTLNDNNHWNLIPTLPPWYVKCVCKFLSGLLNGPFLQVRVRARVYSCACVGGKIALKSCDYVKWRLKSIRWKRNLKRAHFSTPRHLKSCKKKMHIYTQLRNLWFCHVEHSQPAHKLNLS